ncbi:efflux RND transporter permease subunit [Stappia taiwanensis]|uniref:Efflux RND transporter permease subunit n=1 Tax=Stappia taiwanensis TaxID=992267 RepID=A0A838XTM5_9HYPH|nr:efflux RND transporter permease subunit [Stappia taiwanensis]MBA4610404.1 efflux RND transporter permease subunit [Stappia taiwanensis]GGE85252.1 cation efflux system protein [Stappia taiwanensis]
MSGCNLSAWALRHQALVLFFILVTAAAGIWSYTNLGRNEDPAFTVKVMVVTAAWPGASAQEMQEQVADQIETRLQTLPWLGRLETYATPGFMATQIVLDDATPPSEVADLWYQVRKKVGDIRGDLPAGVLGPFFNDEYSDVFVQVHAITAPDAHWSELSDLAEMARQSLLSVPGVEKVQLFGEQDEKIYVDISYAKMATLGIPISAIFDALARQNAVVPSGSVDTPSETVQVRVSGKLAGVEAVAAVPVRAGERTFRLGDVARIHSGISDPQRFAARYNGKPAIMLGVAMADGGNVLELGERLAEKVSQIRTRLPLGAELHQVSNQPEVVEEAIGEFLLKFVAAISIVLLVSFLSLGFRTGIVVALSVPLTLAGTFLVMLQMGIDLERISLGALILSLGLLVDDAIVAIEMMVVKIEQGWDRYRAATFAWESTAFPMLTGTLVTAAGFLPVGFAKSSAGEYAGGIFWVVTSALLISWLVAVVFTPYLGLKLLPRSLERHAAERGDVDEDAIYRTRGYNALRGMISGAVRFRLPVVLLTVGLLASAVYGMGFVKKQFFPNSSRPEILVDLRGPEGAAFAATEREVRAVEAMLAESPDLEYFTSYIGAGAPRFFLAYNPALPNANYALILIQTKGGEHAEKLLAELRARFAASEGAVRGRANRLELGPPVGYPVQFRVVGPDIEEVRRIAARVQVAMRANPDTRDTELQWGEKVKSVRLSVDQDRARALGLTSEEIGLALQALLSGAEATSLRDGRHSVGVVVRADAAERAALGDIGDLVIAVRNGQAIPVSQVARISYQAEEPILWRRNRETVLTVRSDIMPGVQAPDVTAALMPQIEAIEATLPPGYRIDAGGAAEESGKANAALSKVFPVMLLAMMLLIMIQMQSFSKMILVFLTFPLGLVGAVAALLISGEPFGFVAILGVIALGGMVMRNTLILADQIEHDLAAGATMRQAIVESTVRRARPVILTALAAVLAFIPLTTSIFWGPMAVSMIGGLTVATVLTLLFMPALYALWFRRRLDRTDAEMLEPEGGDSQRNTDTAERKTDPATVLPQAAE